jgi:methylenetetrahydrofolate dehydrogenase (NADP+)/methenyltetrahydrofolate cyclohydrolase
VTALLLDGRELAGRLRARASEALAECAAAGITVRLAIVVATTDESAAWYVRSLRAAAARLGIECDSTELPPSVPGAEISAALGMLSADAQVHGIVLQAPLPAGLSLPGTASAIDPAKDVDGSSPLSLGRSVVVGKPVAQLLLARDATVTVCHSRTPDLAAVTREADVLVVAAGRPGLITAEHVRPGAIVIDVGTNTAADGSLTGDVDAASVGAVAGGLSPVPGGVGPVTTAQLLLNTVTAAHGRPLPS